MSNATRFLTRLIGLFLVFMAIAMAPAKAAVIAAVTDIIQQPGLYFTWGIIALAAGLAVVIAHNRWSGGVACVVVTLLGWVMLAKSAMMFWMSPAALTDVLAEVRFADFYYGYLVVYLVLGAYLTYASFRSSGRAKARVDP